MALRSRPFRPPTRGPVLRAFDRVHRFFTVDIWQRDADHKGFPLAQLYRVLRVIQLAIRGIVVNRASFMASALTYTTVLSLVPLLAFAFAIAKGMGAYERLRDQVIDPFLDANLGALTEQTPDAVRTLREAIERILELVSNTDVSSLGIFGLLILIFAVIRVLSNVEDNFNRIWGVRRARTPIRRVADYLSLAVVTPLLMIFAVAVTTGAQTSGVVELMRERPLLATLLDSLFGLTPLLSVWLGFTLLYLLLPNTSVHPVSALLGGIVGGSLWQLAQIGHVKFQVGIANYNAIYSSFAAFPIFLVWIFVSWLTVMFGAEFAHSHQDSSHHRQLKIIDLEQTRRRETLALRAAVRIVQRFAAGEQPWRSSDLAEELAVPVLPLLEVLQPLMRAGLLAESVDEGDTHWLPGRDPSGIRVSELLAALRGEPEAGAPPTDLDGRVEQAYQRFHDASSGGEADPDLRTLAASV